MADVALGSQTTVPLPLQGGDKFPIARGANGYDVPLQDLSNWLGDAVGNSVTADQALTANATTYMNNSQISVPTGFRLAVKNGARWHGTVTKTAAGTAVKSLVVKVGTNGSAADTTLLTFALPAGTAVVDTGYFEINVTVTTIGAAAVIRGTLIFTHNLATTGLMTQNQAVVYATSATFNSDVDSLIFGLAFVAGVAEAWTVKQLMGEGKGF